jgi:hypothetical protein
VYGAPPIICLAASSGNTKILRHLMSHLCFHPLKCDNVGRTSLHYAVVGNLEPCNDDGCTWKTMIKPRQAYPYVWAVDVPNVLWLDEVYESSPQVRGVKKGYSGRKVCIEILLQAGVRLWRKDTEGRVAHPGRKISDEDFLSWWHEKIAKETLERRNSFCQAGNAISVMGVLIATASYVGPLQPPRDSTHYEDVWFFMFMYCNSLSFYCAIASIMLSVVPSLPRVQELVLKESELIQMCLVSSMEALLVSVFWILISFAAASVAAVHKDSWYEVILPTALGLIFCSGGFIKLLRRFLQVPMPVLWKTMWKMI